MCDRGGPGTDATTLTGHIIVCGLDGIGITIVDQLHRGGQQVVVLSEFATPVQLTAVSQWTAGVIAPRGSLEQTLTAAGIRPPAPSSAWWPRTCATSRSPCRPGT